MVRCQNVAQWWRCSCVREGRRRQQLDYSHLCPWAWTYVDIRDYIAVIKYVTSTWEKAESYVFPRSPEAWLSDYSPLSLIFWGPLAEGIAEGLPWCCAAVKKYQVLRSKHREHLVVHGAKHGAWLRWEAQSLWIVLSSRLSILIFTFDSLP